MKNLPKSVAAIGVALVLMLSMGCETGGPVADLVLTNGNIITVDTTMASAQSIAFSGDRIMAIGSDDELAELVGADTEVVDLDGKTAIPGFIEGHGHFMGLGLSRMILDLTTTKNWDDIVAMVKEAAENAEPGEWITGRGWHQEKWDIVPEDAVDGVPTHRSLSEVSPDNPVLLRHASGHAAFANSMAMGLAGISSETPNPMGGHIVHGINGQPTGLLRETAQRLVSQALQAARDEMTADELTEEAEEQVRLAGVDLLSKGITSFQDAGSSFETIDFLKRYAEEGKLPVRLWVMVRGQSNDEMDAQLPDYKMIGHGNNFLTVRAIKRAVDGALGPHGAWLLEPYADMPSTTGLVLESLEDIRKTGQIAMKHGFQVGVHAIGDRGNREVLDIYEKLFKENPDQTDLRWRVEHAQHLHPDDIPRFGELGVIPALQGIHCTSDAPWVYKRLGAERAESGAYMWRDLWDTGAIVTNGTDVPVENSDPIASYYSTVTRMTNTGEAFFPKQALTRMEALQSYTINNAKAVFEEDLKGTLTVGKLGDVTILSDDILTVPDEEIQDITIEMTIVGGEIKYTAESE